MLAAPGAAREEARASAEAFTAGSAAAADPWFRDGFLPYGPRGEGALRGSQGTVDPQSSHACRHDLHQDHRFACELTWNTFRDHLILEYEIPKYDGDLGRPNVFVPLSQAIVDEKLALLEEHFASQRDKHWFDDETFLALMRCVGSRALRPSRSQRLSPRESGRRA